MTVSLVKEEKGTYFVASSISKLSKDFIAYNKAADIHISKDGKFLYASDRGLDSIAIYEVNENGTLKTIVYQAVLGKKILVISHVSNGKLFVSCKSRFKQYHFIQTKCCNRKINFCRWNCCANASLYFVLAL